MKNRKVVVVTGPTASGKSSLGIKLAKEFNGEIISADSRQVYRRMDLGTGKVKREKITKLNFQERRLGKCFSEGVVHYLLDIVDPRKEQFNMVKFQRLAQEAIELIFSQKKTPLIVGGTMLYIDALIKGFQSPGSSDLKLREELESKPIKKLLKALKELDPEIYNKIDRENRYRSIRAIEIKRLTGKSFFTAQQEKKPDFNSLILVISRPRKELYQSIDQRVGQRIDQGMIREIRELHNWGLGWREMERFGLEYRFLSRYLRNMLSKEKAIERLKYQSHRYARQQLVWWRQNKRAVWVKSFSEAKRLVRDFLAD